MRRLIVGLAVTAVITTLLLWIPVYAESGPPPEPVSSNAQEVPLGTVNAPSGAGEVREGTTEDVPGYETALALTVTESPTAEFSLVAVTWRLDAAVTDLVLRLRVKDSSGAQSEWSDLQIDGVGVAPNPEATANGEQRSGSEPVWVGQSFGVELEVLTLSGADPQDVRLILVDPGESPADATPGQLQGGLDEAHAAANAPTIYSRAQWGADESIRSWDPEYASTTKAATLHHTADSNDYTSDEVPAMLRGIYYYHAVSLGWGDIGYNAVVDKFGRIWEGRYGGTASSVIGAHAGGFNTFTFGVSMLGNYEITPAPEAMISSVVAIMAWKLGMYGVDPRGRSQLTSSGGGTSRYPAGQTVTLPNIFGHRDVGSTTCPGQYGYARLDEIRTRVAALTSPALTDISNVAVAAARAASGQTTVVVRGADSTLFTRTRALTGEWGPFRALPAGVSTLGVAAFSDGNHLHLAVRGVDGGYWVTHSPYDANGLPVAWQPWVALGGVFTSAPAVASAGPDLMSIVGRGTDGTLFQMNWDGSRYVGWTSLGGVSVSAPAVEKSSVTGGGYVISTVGLDGRIWRIPTGARNPGATAAWSGAGLLSSLGPQSDSTGPTPAPAGTLTIGDSGHGVLLLNPANGSTIKVGGTATSTVGIVRQPDGGVDIYVRGTDGQLWTSGWSPSRGVFTWQALGGRLF